MCFFLRDRCGTDVRDGPCLRLLETRSRRVFRQFAIEPHHLAERRDVDAQFLFLLGLEPAMLPAPEMNGAAGEPIGVREAFGAFQVELGLVAITEDRGVIVSIR